MRIDTRIIFITTIATFIGAPLACSSTTERTSAAASGAASSGSGGEGGAASSSSGGEGGAGGAAICSPGEVKPCYTGPEGTRDVGACAGGVATCAPDGSGFGACEGEITPAAEDCSTPEDEDCLGAEAQCGELFWSLTAGGAGDDSGRRVAVDASGNIVVAGHFSTSIDFGAGPLQSAGGVDIFIAKFDRMSRALLWNARAGGPGKEEVWDLAIDPAGNIFVAGRDSGGGALVLQLDKGGQTIANKAFGGDAYAMGVAADAMGNILVTGTFKGSIDLGGGPLESPGPLNDAFIARFDAAGNHVFSKRFGTMNDEAGSAVAFLPSGDFLVVGSFDVEIDLGGGALTSAGQRDLFMAQFNAAGGHVWSKAFGGPGYVNASAMAVDPTGDVVLAGPFNGTLDFGGGPLTGAGSYDYFVAKLSSTGAHTWSRRFGDANPQYFLAAATDGSGNVLLTGAKQGSVDFGGGPLVGDNQAFVAKLSPTGDHVWSRSFNGQPYVLGLGVAADATGHVFVTGSFEGTVDFGGGPFVSAGDEDTFLMKLAP